MTSNQQRPTVNQLASDERYARVPAKLRRKNLSPKGHKGICVGRDEMLRGLSDYFVQQWRDSEAGTIRDDDCVAAVLTNAPGAGKTTAREEFAFRHAHQGIAIIEVQPSELADDADLITALKGYANQPKLSKPIKPRENPSLLRRAWHRGTEWLLKSEGVPISAGGAAMMALDGGIATALTTTGTIKSVQEAILRFRKKMRWSRPKNSSDALKMLNETHEGKFIITVDECHKLGNPEVRSRDLHKHIEYLANPTGRTQLGIQGGGLLLAGLASFPDELDGLGLTRAQVEWLDELDGDSAEAIVRHYLKRTEMPEERRKAITRRWVPELAHAFRYWPQHSAAAGAFANELLTATNSTWQYNPKDPDEYDLLQHVTTLAARDIQRLYQQRVRNAMSAQPAIQPEDIAALANITHDRIPPKALVKLLTSSQKEAGLPMSTDDLMKCLRDLKRTGLCRNRTVQRDGRKEEYYSFGMPSLQQHITENAPPKLMQECTERAQRIIKDTGG